MANTIKIKRNTTDNDAPTTLPSGQILCPERTGVNYQV